MRRILVIVPILAIVSLIFAGCGNGETYTPCLCFDYETHMWIEKSYKHGGAISSCEEYADYLNSHAGDERYGCKLKIDLPIPGIIQR